MSDYFSTDNDRDMEWLENVLRTAREAGRRVRLDTSGAVLRVKVGEGMWTAPVEGTADPYRDNPRAVRLGVTTWSPDGQTQVTTFDPPRSIGPNGPIAER